MAISTIMPNQISNHRSWFLPKEMAGMGNRKARMHTTNLSLITMYALPPHNMLCTVFWYQSFYSRLEHPAALFVCNHNGVRWDGLPRAGLYFHERSASFWKHESSTSLRPSNDGSSAPLFIILNGCFHVFLAALDAVWALPQVIGGWWAEWLASLLNFFARQSWRNVEPQSSIRCSLMRGAF